MARKRIGIIHSPGTTEWTSCKVIGSNLEKAYRSALGNEAEFFSCDWRRPSDLQASAARIARARLQELVFLGHSPHPDTLLVPLKNLYGGESLPAIRIHVYGDFTRNSREWVASEPLLKGIPVQWICASERQARMISGLLQNPGKSVVECPFPVSREEFSADFRARLRWRSRLRLSDDDVLILYCGRFSSQKNCVRLMDEVLRFSRKEGRTGRSVRFAFAGSFDDLGSPFFGSHPKRGTSKKQWKAFLGRLSPDDRRKFLFLGELSANRLRAVYNAADLAASLSLYHDEDFGMFPAEALSCGTPCVLTSWGGFASFPGAEKIPVRLGKGGLTFSSGDVQRALLAQSRDRLSESDRMKRSARFLARYSVEAVASRLEALCQKTPKPFQGFSERMRRHALALRRSVPFEGGPKTGGLYEEIYRPYFRP